MRRNPEISRKLLQEMEASEDWLFVVDSEGEESAEDEYHRNLLLDEGFIVMQGSHSYRMSAAGHDFVEATRDEAAWSKIQEVGKAVGNSAIGFLTEIAKGIARQKLSEMGVPIK